MREYWAISLESETAQVYRAEYLAALIIDVAENQARTMAVMRVVLAIQFLLLLMAGRIQRAIGDAGASVVSRVMGTINAALAASMGLAGLKAYVGIA